MNLSAEMTVKQGTLVLDVALELEPETVVAVVGPNGAGKTTLVRTLSGLVPLDRGYVRVGSRLMEDREANIRLPPERRNIGVVFQEHRLFASMSALDNVAFGLRARGVPRRVAQSKAAAWLDRVGLGKVAAMRPRQLSGGQAQRVALARALAVEPEVLLLDEPLAAVDVAARTELRHLIREELYRYPGVRLLVTHDPLEAAALAQRLIVLEDGHITQQGPLADVTARPRSAWVATMLGLNLLTGRAAGSTVTMKNGARISSPESGDGPVFVAIRPNAITLHRQPPHGSARNVFHGKVQELHLIGDRTRVRIDGEVPLVAEVTPAAVAELRLADRGPIWASVKATDVETYPV